MANVDCGSARDKAFTVYRHLALAKHSFLQGKPYEAREHLSQIASALASMRRDADGDTTLISTIREAQEEVSKLINLTQAYAFFKHYAPQELSRLAQGIWNPKIEEEQGTYEGSKGYKRYTPIYTYGKEIEGKQARVVQGGTINTDPFNELEQKVRGVVNQVYRACPIK